MAAGQLGSWAAGQLGSWAAGQLEHDRRLDRRWVTFVTVLFWLPPISPITIDTFNYAPIAFCAVLVLAATLWAAKGWRIYAVPENGTAAERERMEQDIA